MTKQEFTKTLEAAIGGTEYAAEVIAYLTAHFDETGKYTQTVKDRLDERLGSLEGWEKKHKAEGNDAAAAVEAEKIALVKKALAAIA